MAKANVGYSNVKAAHEFANSFDDPVVREVLWTAYAVLIFKMGVEQPDGTFDVLYFFKALAKMLEDREQLQRVLSGNFSDD